MANFQKCKRFAGSHDKVKLILLSTEAAPFGYNGASGYRALPLWQGPAALGNAYPGGIAS
ncbi:MAG TPA: hypothetical protein VKR06_29625 [Ktedonosporobacter sp.]|nr:hypothetical protein [Ktedonosporobacter sp.]